MDEFTFILEEKKQNSKIEVPESPKVSEICISKLFYS